MKIISWNVNGIRAILKKGFIGNIQQIDPDIICLQETKATREQVKDTVALMQGYHIVANASKGRKGYSGTAILSKEKPLSVTYDMGIEDHDQEGRVISAEYEAYYLVNVYVPNSGSGLARLEYRKEWDGDFLKYLKALEVHKPVIICGDLNVAHQPIDLARPKSNYNKTAGYTQTEIDGFSRFLDQGFVDTFRHFYPEEVKYTWWSFRMNAREKNIGWRIDYFLVSEALVPKIREAFILNEYEGSDHCPLGIIIN